VPCNLLPDKEHFTGENSVHSLLDSLDEDPYDLSVFIDQVGRFGRESGSRSYAYISIWYS
jgi:hypothetical protein